MAVPRKSNAQVGHSHFFLLTFRCFCYFARSMSPPDSDTVTAPPNETTSDVKAPIVVRERRDGGELFIVDNSDSEWKGLKYLQDWTEIASAFDIASGFFEIGSLLALDGQLASSGKDPHSFGR